MDVSITEDAATEVLDLDEQRELELAAKRLDKIHDAAGIALVDGVLTAVFAVLSAPFAIFSLPGLFVTIGLSLVAFNGFRGRKRLLALDPTAPNLLGWNQLALLTMIIIYCAWMLYSGLNDPASVLAQLLSLPEFNESMKAIKDLPNEDQLLVTQILILFLYVPIIVLSLFFQGGMAWYYFSRRKFVEAHADGAGSAK